MGAVDVLWTAEWDSTFRVADLLLNQNAAVRTWYAVDQVEDVPPVPEISAAVQQLRSFTATTGPGTRWFCHSPLRGQPYGYCNPCSHTRDEGLGRRVPPRTLWRRIEVGLLTSRDPDGAA